ncbi:MAG TPA: rhodanese-like domain-containing protein [Aquaticitalea sp.]|nr:rhodanese-like domain-containing protein [Aquaticitalea sp.]HNU60054.1 rhodanese-like domain-containing protein [Aquaticitalea sp.]
MLDKHYSSSENSELESAMQERPFLVDVRTEEEFAHGSVSNAVNIPLNSIYSHMADFDDKCHIVVFCKSGIRSEQAKTILELNGFTNVINGGSLQNVKNHCIENQ